MAVRTPRGWTALVVLSGLGACAPDNVLSSRDAGPVDAPADVATDRAPDAATVDVPDASDVAVGSDAPDAPETADASETADATDSAAPDVSPDAPLDAPLDAPAADVPPDAAADAPDAPMPPAREVLVATGSVWRYLDDGTAPSASWTSPAFRDDAWRSGRAQLGYGDGDEATVVRYGPDASNRFITTYFRRAFDVASPSDFRAATLRLLRDDGAVVYLNGREVLRSNMPAGAVAGATRASANVGGADESTFFEGALDPSALVAGTNVLAVEVHQSAPDSSDVSFDLELAASRAAADVDPVFVGAGDISRCDGDDDEATARLLDATPGTVFLLGDNVYQSGTDDEFARCFGPTWGRHRARSRPAVGNHEYLTPGAAGYFRYFGAAAGDPAQGWYSYELGAWHVVVLNSNCAEVGGCDAGSPQDRWLAADLAAHPARCTLAYWHHPRFSSGAAGSSATYANFFQRLYDADAEVVLTGHDHGYERFAPQDPAGRADAARGIRHFVVGTGGTSLTGFPRVAPNSEVRNGDTFGVLRMVLHPGGYDWRFVPVAGRTFTDSGTGMCH